MTNETGYFVVQEGEEFLLCQHRPFEQRGVRMPHQQLLGGLVQVDDLDVEDVLLQGVPQEHRLVGTTVDA